jgi:hypothetical protein
MNLFIQNDERTKMDIQLELDEIDAEILTMSVAMLMRYTEERIERHRNHKDYSMDKLFAKMEMLARTGDLWARLQKAQGTTQEEIALFLREAGNE